MVSNFEKPFKEGYLLFPPHGVLGQLKKSWQKKYCQLFKASKYGIERLEVFDNEDEAGKTSSIPIITLENCVKITPDSQKLQPHTFIVVTKTIVHHIAANSDYEMRDWIAAFQSVAFKDNASRQTIEEDNDLYCSAGDAGVFSVKLVPSEASERCGLSAGHYTLVLTPSALQLRDSSEQTILFTWPYKFIRRYGKSAGKFTFEAGRKCESGEGTFHLEHSNHQEIFRCISTKMNYMKKLLIGDPLPPSPAIVCGDNQFNAALSMNARSRSPLPPSPTSATSPIMDAELCAISSVKPMMPNFCDSHERLPSPRGSAIIKPKPKKPPRKFPPVPKPQTLPFNASLSKSLNGLSSLGTSRAVSSSNGTIPKAGFQNNFSVASVMKAVTPTSDDGPTYSNITVSSESDDNNEDDDSQAYDDVEVRSEAWRTMGIDEAAHTERPFSFNKNQESKFDVRSQHQDSSKVFIQPPSMFNDYDRLQHFGPVSKSNSGYKQINAIATLTSTPVFPHFEDDIQVARRADDSHLGYGIIRKKTVPSSDETSNTRHATLNNQDYAIVCKPNRV